MEAYTATVLFLQVIAMLGTHVLFATLGGILCEKVGNLNLGLEGLMLLGASFSFYVALNTGQPWLALGVGCLAAVAGALIYAFLTVTLRANQVVTGLALTIFGTGVSSMLGKTMAGVSLPISISATFGARAIPGLEKIPVLGPVFFRQSPFVLVAVLLAVVIYFFYTKTRIGLNTRMIGENPGAADASGINVTRYKYCNILLCGLLCGAGGVYLSCVYAGIWQNELTAGAGWIAVAMVIFAIWNPLRAILGAYLFGAIRGLGFKFQGGIPFLFGAKILVNAQILDMLPYITTILVLVFINMRKKKEYNPPASLGGAYFREDR
ncbi:MAG: ABC transporter permease [Peptococcaceae bacterium]|jgi:simple sugar transport system permease protein|nr:ABC transporter permease [Peptococcaceae bacterium]